MLPARSPVKRLSSDKHFEKVVSLLHAIVYTKMLRLETSSQVKTYVGVEEKLYLFPRDLLA